MIKRFNLRVYGLLVRNGKLLVSSEQYKGHHLVKFPGGGVEYGEGVKDALKREWQEELQTDIEIGELIYVTDYFLPSAFNKEDQIICIYYRIHTEDVVMQGEHEHELLWIDLKGEEYNDFSFPQEQKVYEMLRTQGI